MSLALLTTCDNSIDANLIKTRLESEGIPCFVHNEHITNLLPNTYNLLGSGARVLVPEDRLEEAIQLIKPENDTLCCPNCESEDIVNKIEKPGKRIWSIIMAIFVAVPFANHTENWLCNNCVTEFRK